MERDVILNRMRRLCNRGERCRSDILRKVVALGTPEPESVVEQLVSEGYIDDARYARAFARDKSSLQGWGKVKIRVDLQRKGIEESAITAALSEIDSEAAEKKLQKLALAKLRQLRNESDTNVHKAKFLRYLMGRGYTYDEIVEIYDDNRTD
ncbi:MAG TPA: regulatory protein RecX [Bacteroidales bacterium]|jgi:regulatory protein|nr:regulatory protein RecX [Bacteroidales bacterium]HPB88781.1 regulatory protein RecX [Bacteroidales bacterium]HPY22275.1 regulatory protein RecX [Bacteroidales bacterium]HQA93776.1 regulatory protein RecX [Bacteroidales bacterium]HQN23631.1 regulatory protein RecX [Bacteroidales bacterium]